MSPGLPILYLCALGGLVLVVGCLWLLATARIVLDRQTRQVSEIELPLGFKLKTHVPVLVLFVLGGGLLVYAAQEVRNFGEEVSVDGDVAGPRSEFQLYAAVTSASLPSAGRFSIALPVTHPPRKYMLIFTMDGKVIHHQLVDPGRRKQELPRLEITPGEEEVALIGEIHPLPAGYE